MTKNLSPYKFKRLAKESFKNGLRLHFDAIYLFKKGSYASAFQLSVLAMEEISKASWVEHYYWTSITNSGFPEHKFEQEWLKLLYLHPATQKAFFSWSAYFEYSPSFVKFVENKQLELKKQRATYVGLEKTKGGINVNSRISTPNRIKKEDAKKMISLLNDYLKDICKRKFAEEFFFDIEELDELIDKALQKKLKEWQYRSGLRSKKWYKEWQKEFRKNMNSS